MKIWSFSTLFILEVPENNVVFVQIDVCLTYPPYSSDIAPSDFHLFRILHFLNVKKFENLNATSEHFSQKSIDLFKFNVFRFNLSGENLTSLYT